MGRVWDPCIIQAGRDPWGPSSPTCLKQVQCGVNDYGFYSCICDLMYFDEVEKFFR